MACAQDGQARPSLEAAVDLLKGAARMRMRRAGDGPFLHAEHVLAGAGRDRLGSEM
jgi:hypothetical protein